MSVYFQPETLIWRQSAVVAFGGGGYELDTAKVPWRGAVTTKLAFIAGLKKFEPLAGNPRMFLESFDDDQAAVFPTVTLNYIGVRNGANGGALPPPKGVDSLVQKSLSVQGESSPLVEALSFTGNYLTPRTTWTWYMDAKPDPISPKYAEARGNFSPAASLFNLRTSTGAPVSLEVALKYVAPLKLATMISDYTVTDIVDSNLWQCSCVADREFTR